MVGQRKCYVPFCGHRKRKMQCAFLSFPSNPSRCKEWVQRVGVLDFVYQPVEMLSKLRFVCSCHFTDQDFSSTMKRRLKNIAVPSIFDKRVQQLSDEILNEFPPKKVLRTESIRVKIPSEDLENMKKYQPVLKEIKQDKVDKVSDSHNVQLNNKVKTIVQRKPQKRYRSSVATKRKTIKKLMEESGIAGAEMTPEVKQLLQLLHLEKKTSEQLQKELDKYVRLTYTLQDQLDRLQKNVK